MDRNNETHLVEETRKTEDFISAQGARALVDALKANTTLTALKLKCEQAQRHLLKCQHSKTPHKTENKAKEERTMKQLEKARQDLQIVCRPKHRVSKAKQHTVFLAHQETQPQR